MRFASIAIASCLLLLSGCTTAHPNAPQPSATKAPATQPDREASPGLALRMTGEWNIILILQREYLAREGPARRGLAFEELIKFLAPGTHEDHWTRPLKEGERNPNPISELEVLMLLGQPDKYYSGEWGAEMFYRYKNKTFVLTFGQKPSEDWAAILKFNSEGILTLVGVNEASVLMPPETSPGPATTRPAAATSEAGNGFLGVMLEPETWEDDRHLYYGTNLKIARVLSGSPAERAGLRVGEVITQINSVPVGEDLLKTVRRLHPGEEVTLTVRPSGKTSPSDNRTVRVTVGRRPFSTTQP
jgi:hypothetical protein